MRFCTEYLDEVYCFDSFQKRIKRTAERLKKLRKVIPFDAIAFRGTSGAAFAYPLSYLMKMPIICVRKDRSHCNQKIEGPRNIDIMRYIIIDDFIETGRTIKAIINEIERADFTMQIKCVAIVLYKHEYSKASNVPKKWFDPKNKRMTYPIAMKGKEIGNKIPVYDV